MHAVRFLLSEAVVKHDTYCGSFVHLNYACPCNSVHCVEMVKRTQMLLSTCN